MENILELRQVSKSFPGSSFRLEDISFSLPYGAVLGFVGENGAGKTSTIGCILNTIAQYDGSIKLFGKEMRDSDTDIRERIGVVYDGENWDKTLFRHYLEKFKLAPTQKIKQYSRGMTMKLAIAAALSHHPQLLVLDEATSGLDPIMRDEMLDVFLDFVQDERHSILLSSHITSDLEKIADYITFIHNGRLIFSALKDDLRYNYAVMRCSENQFQALNQEDMMAYLKRDYQVDVLLSDGKAAQRKYKDAVIDHVSIEEIMLLLIKGERI